MDANVGIGMDFCKGIPNILILLGLKINALKEF